MKIVILDSANQPIGFVQKYRVYDAKGKFVAEVRPEITIKEIKERLLNEQMKGYVA